jgi:hypothetical protein
MAEGISTPAVTPAPVVALALVVDALDTLGAVAELIQGDGFADTERRWVAPALDSALIGTEALFDTVRELLNERVRAGAPRRGTEPPHRA